MSGQYIQLRSGEGIWVNYDGEDVDQVHLSLWPANINPLDLSVRDRLRLALRILAVGRDDYHSVSIEADEFHRVAELLSFIRRQPPQSPAFVSREDIGFRRWFFDCECHGEGLILDVYGAYQDDLAVHRSEEESAFLSVWVDGWPALSAIRPFWRIFRAISILFSGPENDGMLFDIEDLATLSDILKGAFDG